MTAYNDIDRIIDEIIRLEGSAYTNHPSDKGGPTKYGVTQRTLSQVLGRPASIAEVQNLSESMAREIYRRMYVVDPGFDAILTVMPKVAHELVDSGVNAGVGRASEWLQRSLNALNRQGKDYPDIKVDGDIGPVTMATLRRLIAIRGLTNTEIVLFRMLNALQGAHYIAIAEGRPQNEDFVFGWFLNRVR
jgi:lysozyme family protein